MKVGNNHKGFNAEQTNKNVLERENERNRESQNVCVCMRERGRQGEIEREGERK